MQRQFDARTERAATELQDVCAGNRYAGRGVSVGVGARAGRSSAGHLNGDGQWHALIDLPWQTAQARGML